MATSSRKDQQESLGLTLRTGSATRHAPPGTRHPTPTTRHAQPATTTCHNLARYLTNTEQLTGADISKKSNVPDQPMRRTVLCSLPSKASIGCIRWFAILFI